MNSSLLHAEFFVRIFSASPAQTVYKESVTVAGSSWIKHSYIENTPLVSTTTSMKIPLISCYINSHTDATVTAISQLSAFKYHVKLRVKHTIFNI